MTAYHMVYLGCDGTAPDGFPCDSSTADEGTEWTATECRERFRRHGWHRSKGKDICPDCWKRGER